MNWLTNFVRPKIRAWVGQPAEVPDNLWVKCPSCQSMIFHRELEANLQVCTHCNFHMKFDAQKRLDLLLDNGWALVDMPKPIVDPLKFRDMKRYSDRLKEAQTKTGEQDVLKVGSGTISGIPAVVAVFNFSFMGGSMGTAVGDGLLAAAREAVKNEAAFIVIPASGGARMQEGILSLMQMPRTTIAVDMVKEAGLPYIVLLTDPTSGGVTASFAMLGDIHIAEPGALIAFAGARVVENTIREKLPEGFQRAEFLLQHGILDLVVPRAELKAALSKMLRVLMRGKPSPSLEAPRGAAAE
ncbi:acetyl-CoA carboxylase, carboxyltransferase subunit beta [Lacibacterium aquatile]|uniref:Acetyl-coenzyme A carboxylase carboxyl transferase subunit beta n=1 Tax=Lacibacterium aquatile TaxID=1168082 RepID=A0ABW5DM11_9PROT